jgi:transposase
MQYAREVREAVVRKALAGEMTQEEIAKAHGVSRSSVQQWMRKARKAGKTMVSEQKRPRDWSTEERFAALVETHGLDEEELGAWCRRHGVHTHDLAQWRRDMLAGVRGGEGSGSDRGESKRLRQENASLRKELTRKEKALAETTALFVLQKKVRRLWGEDEDT